MTAQANLHGIMITQDRQKENQETYFDGVESKIKQVFINIIKNAIEALEHGGRIHIATRHKGGTAIISFIDNGSGIPEEIIEKIGKPFFTTKENGTGLGLMVSKSIIESHNGELTIESELGVGTTINVCLPTIKG